MSTNHVYRRQPHSALRKKRFHPASKPKLPVLDLENRSNSGNSRREEPALDRRQIIGLPTDVPIPPLTDFFPPFTTTDSPPTTTDQTTTSETTTTSTPTTTSTSTTSTSTSTTPTTTSAATTTTSSTQAPATTTTPATTSRQTVTQTRVDDATVIITNSLSRTSGAPRSTNTLDSSTTDSDSSSSTGPIIGGIVAGVIAVAVLVLSIVWFIRRRKKANDDELTFDPNDFRRSAVLLDDEPMSGTGSAGLTRGPSLHSAGGEHGVGAMAWGQNGNPRPPTMIERKLTQTPASGGFGEYGYNNNAPGPNHYGGEGHGGHSAGGYGYPNSGNPYGYPQQSYGPGQYVEGNANPFASPASAYQSPFSPPMPQEQPLSAGTSRATSPDVSGAPTVLAQVGGAPVLTRSKSMRSMRSMASGKSGKLSISIPKNVPVNAVVVDGSATSSAGEGKVVEYPTLKRKASSSSSSSGPRRNNSVKASVAPPPTLPSKQVRESMSAVPANDYVDLSRSSVSPFQAAQYAEISMRLNSEVPQGLPSAVVEEFVKDRELPPLPPPSPQAQADEDQARIRASPFADPETDSRDSMASGSTTSARILDFPIPPPSPMTFTAAHSPNNSLPGSPMPVFVTKPRIDSLPPMLPEINIEPTAANDLSPHDLTHDGNGRHESFLPPPGMLGLNSAKDSPIYPSPITAGGSPLLGRFPVTPSPLGASFVIETPRPVYNSKEGKDGRLFAMQQERRQREEAQQKQEEMKQKEKVKKERPETVYDPEDAYGGF
ncbi:hypothetical protein EST38_g2416 [Candolleomyces aberdarensis]|uniref:Uncharacterized protein n=1 Tax=Candolleomyces aberdarensis TaxID=2316362 RepID=A0A4Q2DWT9_9AGAR|nr:hypothetical protein EST38_g2416 [Candolleomyces aberdarensis]